MLHNVAPCILASACHPLTCSIDPANSTLQILKGFLFSAHWLRSTESCLLLHVFLPLPFLRPLLPLPILFLLLRNIMIILLRR